MTEYEFIQNVQTYQSRILRLCNNILLNQQAAEDAAQEIFLKAWVKRDQFRAQSQYSTWLHAIAVNTCLSLKKKTRPQVELSESVPASESYTGNLDIETALLKLKPRDRAILYLRAVEEYEFHEIAKMLNISVSAARKRYERAKIKFREKFKHNEGGILNESRPTFDGCI